MKWKFNGKNVRNVKESSINKNEFSKKNSTADIGEKNVSSRCQTI